MWLEASLTPCTWCEVLPCINATFHLAAVKKGMKALRRRGLLSEQFDRVYTCILHRGKKEMFSAYYMRSSTSAELQAGVGAVVITCAIYANFFTSKIERVSRLQIPRSSREPTTVSLFSHLYPHLHRPDFASSFLLSSNIHPSPSFLFPPSFPHSP